MDASREPHPDDARKPDSPAEIKPPNWRFVLKNAVREFGDDQLSDTAAGLTYYTVLSIFPALIALVSILSLLGQSGDLLRNLIVDLQERGAIPVDALEVILPAMESLLEAPAPGVGLLLGLLLALWTASNYVKAFGRAMNRIYEVPEGRGLVKLNLSMYGLTAGLLALVALALVLVTVSGPLARSIGDAVGLGDVTVSVFEFVKWPGLVGIIVVIVALLYWGTPNVRQPRLRWISIGAVVAIVGIAVASALFGFYVANFGSYDETYGTLAGVIIFLFWVNIINTVLLFGGEVDAELERGRQLQGGIEAEEEIQLPMRDDKGAIRKAEKAQEAVEEARELRLPRGESSDPAARDGGRDESDPRGARQDAGERPRR